MTLIVLMTIAIVIYYFVIYKQDDLSISKRNDKPRCKNCGNLVAKDYNVCPICKESLKKPCPQCNEMLEVNWNFCPYCEYKLKKGEEI